MKTTFQLKRGDWSYGTASHNLICKAWIDKVFGPQGLYVDIVVSDTPTHGTIKVQLTRVPSNLPTYIVTTGAGEPALKVLYPTLAELFKEPETTVWISVK